MSPDPKITARIQRWLELPPGERSVADGAELLLRLGRNRVLYHNIMRHPRAMASKLEYELRKHLRIRLDGLTLRDLAVMERQIIPRADETLASPPPASAVTAREAGAAPYRYRGRRADHDSLPPEIQALYERGGRLWRKIRSLRETLETMREAQPCDRYEYTKLLGELDREYRAGWERYDHYCLTHKPAEAQTED